MALMLATGVRFVGYTVVGLVEPLVRPVVVRQQGEMFVHPSPFQAARRLRAGRCGKIRATPYVVVTVLGCA
jgi:hypothetical protein